MIEVVLKVGGSLGRGDSLPTLCRRLAKLGLQHRLLVVPGGGPFADTVRDYGSRYRLGETPSHWMAILAMDQFGYLLCDLILDSEPVRDLGPARKVARAGRIPVLMPFDLVRKADCLPHSWEVTSDSISAWVAKLAAAPKLVLLKDVDVLHIGAAQCEEGSGLLEEITLDQLARCNAVDRYLATIMSDSRLDLWIINGNKPHRVEELLVKGETRGTHLQRSIPSTASPFYGPQAR